VYRLSDRLTVLRDGKNEAVLEHDEIDPKKVIQYMIGKVVDESAGSVKAMRKPTGEVLLHVDGLSGGASTTSTSTCTRARSSASAD
jgi:ribose transport system ATP-binding protein